MKIKILKGKLQLTHKIQKLVEENGYVLTGASNNPKDKCYKMIFDEKKKKYEMDFEKGFKEYDDKHRIGG